MADFKYPGWSNNGIGVYKQPEPNPHPPGKQEDTGYPQTDVKSDGIKIRGTGAAIKGIKSRGPMGGRS